PVSNRCVTCLQTRRRARLVSLPVTASTLVAPEGGTANANPNTAVNKHGEEGTQSHAMHQGGASSPQTVRTVPTPQGPHVRTHHPPHSLSSAHCRHVRHLHLTIPEGKTKQLKQQQQQNCHLVALRPLHEGMRRR
ncbi:regulator of sigma E protease, partial [Trypanosoma cruzi]